ncbi:MAG TPA: GNAT family N-acetyltransferase [Alkalispirochaeta sp.]|nr:GNAT family N-acetyltransferase [Alkalispirochaeta sp.]
MRVQFIDLSLAGARERRGAAEILLETFSASGNPTWTTLPAAEEEVSDCLRKEYVARAALSDEDHVVAWGGLRPMYGNTTWELHPLVVDNRCHGLGIGRALLAHLEEIARSRGVTGIVLGTDDQTGSTSLSVFDPSATTPSEAIRDLAQLPGRHPHPFKFYERCGYRVVGMIPDANGRGQPDILMWKPL